MNGSARRLLTVCVIAAIVSPAVRDHDTYPLSTYPMYASTGERVSTFFTARGFAGGAERRLSIRTIAGTGDPLVAGSLVEAAIARGAADALCAEILARAPVGVDGVEVVSERHDVVARTAGRPSLLERRVHARCER